MDDLVIAAISNHPSIAAAEAKVRRLMAKAPQEKALPDPRLRVSAGSMAETAAGRVEWMAGVDQALPFPGKLREMARAAGREAEAAAAELEAARLDIAGQVRQAYWTYYLAVQTTAITSENLEALDLIRESVDARVAANRSSQDEQLRLAGEAGKIQKAMIESKQAESSARARLNSLLDRRSGAPLPNPEFTATTRRRDLATLIRTAENSHPAVRAAAARQAASSHRLNRAKLERYPDFLLGLQHGSVASSGLAPSANGRDQFIATAGLTLPVWQKPRQAMIEEASAGVEESAARTGSVRTGLRHQVEDAWLRTRSAENLISLFDNQVLPEARQAFEGVLTSYAAGTGSFVDALDSWRQLLAFQLQQAANRAQFGMAVADLERATGGMGRTK